MTTTTTITTDISSNTASIQGLDAQTIEIIKSTVPVLEQHGKAITTRFYELLFENHPELLNVFNHANQKQGRQQTALANAVYAAALHIDRLENILPVVKQISQKHRSLGIQPEHYPIVGENLLAAIQDVLKSAATPAILDAWAKAYRAIAGVFIETEKQMYAEAEHQVGGWTGFRKFAVEEKIVESEVITSFYLKPVDGQPIASFISGQYISLKVQIPGMEHTQLRQYSMSDAPGKQYYRISVKREDALGDKPAGVVSTYLHTQVNPGDTLEISAPAGDFSLNTQHDLPIVLLSGGVGLTPMMSMLNSLATEHPNRNVTFIHAALHGRYHAMEDHVRELAANSDYIRSFVCYEKPTAEDVKAARFDKSGFIDLEFLKKILPNNRADFYFCGPTPFMKAIYRQLKEWNVPAENIHFEFFGPAGSLED